MSSKIRIPYRRLGDDIVRASRENRWRHLGSLIDRNFAEIASRPLPEIVEGSVATTNATTTTALLIPIPASTTTLVEVTVVARRTGGSAGTAEDGAGYRILGLYKNVAGTPTLIGSLSTPFTAESQAGWNATLDVSGTNVRVRVTGAANNNVVWEASAALHKASA